MKRSFQVNINGRIYNIDEDAYKLLNEYLEQLRTTFSSQDEREIVDDIEARINEHFAETVGPDNIINIEDVTSVIEVMGRPEQFCDSSDEKEESGPQTTPPPYTPYNSGTSCAPVGRKKLFRRLDNKVFGGVLSGVATYFDWNVVLLRILFAIATFSFGIFFVVYLIAWMVIPPANTPRRRLEMMGLPVTPDNIARNINCQSYNDRLDLPDSKNFLDALGNIVNILVKAFVGLFTVIVGSIGFGTICAALICIFVACGITITSPEFFNEVFDMNINVDFPSPGLGLTTASIIMLCVCVPCILLTWAGSTMVFGIKGPSRNALIIFAIIEIILIVSSVFLGLSFKHATQAVLPSVLTPLTVIVH